MNKPVVMIIPESNKEYALNELSDILKDGKNNILVRFMDDSEFNLMFNFDCANVDVDMSDETFLAVAKMAHKNDITFNNQILNILKEQIRKAGL